MTLEAYLNATPKQIERRWRQVDLAWQFEQGMRASALPAALACAALGALVDRRFLAVPILLGGWLLLRRLRPTWTLGEKREALRLLYGARVAGL